MHNTIAIQHLPIVYHSDDRGSLFALEQGVQNLPFQPVRTFFLFDVPPDKKRACHAVSCDLFIIALQGSVTLKNITPYNRNEWILTDCKSGLYIPSFHYIELSRFTKDAILVVSASKAFKDTNYFSLEKMKKRWTT